MAAERNNNQQENQLITFLINDNHRSIDLLFSKMMRNENKRETRLSSKISTKGCKYWQLVVSILNILQKTSLKQYLSNQGIYDTIIDILSKGNSLNNQEYSKLSNLVKKIYNYIIYNKSSDFYQFFYNNDGNTLVNLFTTISELQEGINYLCLYDKNKESQNKHISHYFTILRMKGQYYLTSSYGSEFVCVPSNTIKLDILELENLIKALNNINDNMTNTESLSIIKSFYDTYFFQGNIPISISDDLMNEYGSFLNYLKIGSKLTKGPSIEFNYIHKNVSKNTYHIGIIPKYETEVKSYVNKIVLPQTSPTYGHTQKSHQKKISPYSRKNTNYLKGGKYRKRTFKKIRKTKK